MSQIELARFARACVRDGRPEALQLGRAAFARMMIRRKGPTTPNGKT